MAYDKAADGKDKDIRKSPTDDDFMSEMRERYHRAVEKDSTLREDAIRDIKFAFLPGEQWDETQKRRRGKRPCYEFNRLRQALRQVTGEQRKNRPQVKIRAVEDSDKKTADTLQGLIRNIESVSGAEWVYDTAFKFAVAGGFGAWRITTDYCADTAWDQELRVKEIANPFTVAFDPDATEWDRRDGWYAFVTEWIGEEEYERRWPSAEKVSFDDWTFDHRADWYGTDGVRIAEYWLKKPIDRTMILLSDGRTVDEAEIEKITDELAAKGVVEVKRRVIKSHKVMQYIVSGAAVLETREWAGKYIPIVPLWGDLINVEGREYFSGMVRFSKDAQRLYNFNRTTAMEQVAKSPKAPYLLTAAQIKGYEAEWKAANVEDFPYMRYNVDPEAPGLKPNREPGIEIPAAMVAMLQLDSEDLKATTGLYDASLGARSNETSGVAIRARQNEGNTATFEYMDNLSRSIRYTGEILVDMVPRIYDTKRTIRILGEDNAEQFVVLNEEVQDEQTGEMVKVNDVTRGRYDVTVSVGPSFESARQEMAEVLSQVSQGNPAVAPVLSDLIVKSLDLPGSDEAVKRLRKMMIKQGIVDPTPDDLEEAAKAQQGMPPKEPSPQEQLEMRNAQAEVQQKEIANAQAMKDLQAPPEVDNAGAVQAAQMQMDGQKAQLASQTTLQVEQMKVAQAQWEMQAKIELELAKARIDQETKLQIAQMEAASRDYAASNAGEVKVATEFLRAPPRAPEAAQ